MRPSPRAALGLLVAAGVFGCNDEVSLGDFEERSREGASAPLPECGDPGEVGAVNQAGAGVGVTITTTDWQFDEPFDSFEWEVRVEVEPANDGYLWADTFSLEAGNTGLVALQGNGGYQADPPTGPTDIAKMVQFWLSGPALRAELGSISYPAARTSIENQLGVEWSAINARYDWQACRAYRFSVNREGTEPGGGRWYSARIRDSETGAETLIGRILAPEAWGAFVPRTQSFTSRFGWTVPGSCAEPDPVSTLFGAPEGNGGALKASARSNGFAMPPLCASSRFTNFPNAVRQEVGQLL